MGLLLGGSKSLAGYHLSTKVRTTTENLTEPQQKIWLSTRSNTEEMIKGTKQAEIMQKEKYEQDKGRRFWTKAIEGKSSRVH